MRKALITAALAAAVLGACAPGAWAQGRLVQLSDPFDCVALADPACQAATGIGDVRPLAVSPNGRQVYAAGGVDDAVVTFDRDPATGALTQRLGCISDAGAGGCTDGEALNAPFDLAISPDGTSMYVASTGGVAVLDRAPDGTLTQKPGTDGCVTEAGGACEDGRAVNAPRGVAVSPDGTTVYVGSLTNTLAVFDRSPDGRLEQKAGTSGCLAVAQAGCAPSGPLSGVDSVAVSPDGANVYATARTSQAVAVFARMPNGNLDHTGCVALVAGAGCDAANLLDAPRGLVVSPDGEQVYVTSFLNAGSPSGLAIFDRDPVDGSLSQPPAPSTAGCIAQNGNPTDPDCQQGQGVFGATDVGVSPDGAHVYVATQVGVATLDRLASGALAQRSLPDGCLRDPAFPVMSISAGCAEATAVGLAEGIAITPDGANVYTAAGDTSAIAAFDRDAPPACRDVRRTAFHATAREIALDCSDPNADALAYAVVTGPAHGALGAAGPTISYTPAAGFTGIDTFTYRATANGSTSNVATVTVEVLPPGPGPQTIVKTVTRDRSLLVVAFVDARVRARRGKAFALRFVATMAGTATLDVLKGSRRVARTGGRVVAGGNRLRVRRAPRKGRYTLRLTVRGADGQRATETGRLVVTR